jgi:AcrR family transcriptional regulator
MSQQGEFKIKTKRSAPSQDRGKERVRQILAAALHLFRERGLEQVTTNDIVERAGVPIGSLYRYYPNKEAIIAELAELYVADISKIFEGIGNHPMIEHLSWDELLLLMVDGWVNYIRLNGSFALLLAIKTNSRLFKQNEKTWQKLVQNFGEVLARRCPSVSQKDIVLCFQFCLMAVEMGIDSEAYEPALGSPHPHYDAVGVIATYMLRVCNTVGPHDDAILA